MPSQGLKERVAECPRCRERRALWRASKRAFPPSGGLACLPCIEGAMLAQIRED